MSINEQDALALLTSLGAVITDSHLVYVSRKHGSAYFNKDAVYVDTHATSRLCQEIAQRFANHDIEAVIAPAIGGVILSQWIAHHLTAKTGKEVRALYAEKETIATKDPEGTDRKCFVETGRFTIGRGYDKHVLDKRVLVVEDVLNTGGSVEEVVAAVRKLGGTVIGVGALVNRGGVTAEKLGVPKLEAVMNVAAEAWDADECPLCAQGVEINTSVGKGKEFLASKRK